MATTVSKESHFLSRKYRIVTQQHKADITITRKKFRRGPDLNLLVSGFKIPVVKRCRPYHDNIMPAIKVRKNSSCSSRGCYPRKLSVIS
jgi:hypothetical protein